MYEDAIAAYKKKDYETALQLFESLLESEPNHEHIGKIAFLVGKSAHKLGKLKDNLTVFDACIEKTSNTEIAHVKRVWQSYYYASIGDMKNAQAICEMAPQGSNSERELLLSLIGYYVSNDDVTGANDVAAMLRSDRKDDLTLEDDINIMLAAPHLSFDGGQQQEQPEEGSTDAGSSSFEIYPNPFNSTTSIKFNLTASEHVNVRVFNLLGREVRSLADRQYNAGTHMLTWDGRDNHGVFVSSGIYIVRMQHAQNVNSLKISFIK